MTTIGIIGAGHIGGQVARAVTGLGYDVVIANSRDPETLADLVAELGPTARAGTAAQAAAAADIAVVTVPLKAYREVPVEPLAGKIVLDTNNYYWERDGHIAALDSGEATVTRAAAGAPADVQGGEGVQPHHGQGHHHRRHTRRRPANRRALATASDHPEAVEFVTALYDQLGFDTVDIGPLSESWRVERDRPAYVVRQNRDELLDNLAKAPRTI